jgi:MYXO-CTERM domain-containing protein
MMMKKIPVMILFSLLLVGTASAYMVSVDAPTTLTKGDVLTANGTSNIPAGVRLDVALFSPYSGNQYQKNTVVIQPNGQFNTTFQTTDLLSGDYKVEVLENKEYPIGSSAVVRKVVTIVDRSGEATVTAPLSQTFNGSLLVSGTAKNLKAASILVTVTGQGSTIFGPQYILTDEKGAFQTLVPITAAGIYTLILADNAGTISQTAITVGNGTASVQTTTASVNGTGSSAVTTMTTAANISSTVAATTPMTPATTQSSPLPWGLALLGVGLLALRRQ